MVTRIVTEETRGRQNKSIIFANNCLLCLRMCIFCCTFAVDMRKVLFFILCTISTIALSSQTHNSADQLFQAGDYVGASEAYAILLKSYPTDALYLYRYARCAQELGDDTTAIQYFIKSGDRYKLKYFYLGESYLRLWRAEEAIEAYNTYLNRTKEPNEREAYITKQITKAEKIQRYLRRVERVQIIDSVEVALDSMLQVCTLSAEAGTLKWDSIGSTIYTNQRGDRQLRTSLVDSSRILIATHRLLDDWTQPDTLPYTINFTQDQRSPYMLNDGVTLYFAANDSDGLGGLDIYVSRYNMATENFTTPENVGMPYNSPANEYLFVLDEMRQVGYLATDRFATEGRVHIYSFAIAKQKQYWRNIVTDSLITYARLERFETGSIDTIFSTNHSAIVTENTDEIGDFCFVVNDSIIYHSLHDFQNMQAKEKYLAWIKAEQQYRDEQQQLASLRKQYATANEDQLKEELTPVILRLENNQSQLRIQCQALLREIRQIEMSAR